MKRLNLLLGTLIAAHTLLTAPALAVSAASVEDVYRAMAEIGMPAAFIQDTRNQFPNTVHDDDGMELNGEYHTYEEWETLILENGIDFVFEIIADEFCVDKDRLIEYYMRMNETTAPPADEPAQTTTTTAVTGPGGIAFSDMTLQQKREYIMSLPEDERIAFLASLTPEERNSILRQLDSNRQNQAMQGMLDIAQQLGMHAAVDIDDDGNVRMSLRDENGNLLDSSSITLHVDATGWNTTLPVLGAAAVMLGAAGGLLFLTRRCNKQEE